ncbi:MAG TPA: ComEA family DNA-binding protein [Acidimicrobiales bacterium]
MDDPTDDDGRAARALAELRQTRSGPPAADRDELGTSRDRPRSLPAWGELAALDPALLARFGVAAVVAVLVGVGAWFVVNARGAGSGEVSPFAATAVTDTTLTPAASAGAASSTTLAEIVVHAAGAVARPGLQRLAPGARVADLLDAAGGPAPDADLDRLNLAAPLADGQRLYVPRVGESAPAPVSPEGGGGAGGGSGGSGGTAAPTGPVDLNTATAEELDALPGVGPATAAAIIDHRERNGRFGSVDDLLDVRGIGPAKLEGLRDLVVAG